MIPGWRLSGGGNDFLALAEPDNDPSPAQVRAWCRRGLSLGADGVFVLRRAEGAVVMAHFNPDGGRAELCLNGARCAARLAGHLGWGQGEMAIDTDAGRIRAVLRSGTEVELTVPPPQEGPRPLTLAPGAGEPVEAWYVRVGVPHLVVTWNGNLRDCPVSELGPPLRSHPDLGPAGANVDFVSYRSPHGFHLRTFERGVEGETLACGTGVLAAAASGLSRGLLQLPVEALTGGGFRLTVSGTWPVREEASWTLAGDARLVARLEIHPAALSIPEPPHW